MEMVLTNRLLQYTHFQIKFRNKKYGDTALFQVINKFCLRHIKAVESYYHFGSSNRLYRVSIIRGCITQLPENVYDHFYC